jgi:hypothetical protein
MLQPLLTPRVCDYVQMFAGSFRTRFSRNRFSSLGLWTEGQTACLRTYTLAFSLQFCRGMREKKKGEYSIEHQSCCLHPSKTDMFFHKLRFYFFFISLFIIYLVTYLFIIYIFIIYLLIYLFIIYIFIIYLFTYLFIYWSDLFYPLAVGVEIPVAPNHTQ